MKKSIAIVLGVASLAACTKSSVSYEQTDEISFAPVASVNKTKAAVEGTAFPDANLMGVYAYYNSTVKAGSEAISKFGTHDNYLSDAIFSKNDNVWAGWKKTDTGGEHNPYYWPKTGSLLFAAYSPETAELTHKFEVNNSNVTDEFSKTGYVQSSDLSKTVDLLWSPVTTTSYDKTSGKGGVPMTFYHAMSWVTFKAVAKDIDSDKKFRVKSVTLDKVINKGDLKTSVATAAWSLSSNTEDQKTLNVYSNDNYVEITTTAVTLENSGEKNGVVVIPQSLDNVILKVVFAQKTGNTNNWTADQTLDINLKTCKVNGGDLTKWEFGKHYTYTLSFSFTADEITIYPTLTNWEEKTVDNITVQ